MNDGRALKEEELAEIQKNVFRGCYHDRELDRLFETIHIQRRVLAELFNLFKTDFIHRVDNADPVRHSALLYLKELVSMEDKS